MRSANLDGSAIVVASTYTREAGRAATVELLGNSAVIALAASNDLLALGAYEELRAHKILCPDDVSVVGHNDMPLVDMVDPPLTTVRIGYLAMGEAAAGLLLRQMEGSALDPAIHGIASELVVRASTSRPRALKLRKASR